MAEMNARAQVDDALQKRREWLIKEKLFAKLVQYQNIVKAKSGMDKKNYIKKHFFDVVYPRGGHSQRLKLLRCFGHALPL